MEFRCSECGHIGPAEEVSRTEGGVELECAECGATSPLDVDRGSGEDGSRGEGADLEASPGSEGAAEAVGEMGADVEGTGASRGRPTFDAADPVAVERGDSAGIGGQSLRVPKDEAVQRLIPETGAGARCPKCAKLLSSEADNCVRCGLDLEEARNYDEGEAPWEGPPPDDDGAFERAEQIWEKFTDEREVEKLDRFVEFADERGLYEMAIRRVRFYLVDRPEDEAARDALEELVSGVQTQIASARAKAEVDAEELNEEIEAFKRKLILSVLGLWAAAIGIFVYLFWW